MSLMAFLIPMTIGIGITGIISVGSDGPDNTHLDNLSESEIEDIINNANSDKKIVYKTNMKNEEFLKRSINEYGAKLNNNGQLNTSTDNGLIYFDKTDTGTFNMIFSGNFTQENVNEFSKNITDIYNGYVQEETYMKVLEKIKENNYVLENETIDNNQNITLTLQING